MRCYAVTHTSVCIDTAGKFNVHTRFSGVFNASDAIEFLEFMALDGAGQKDLVKKLRKKRPERSYAEWTSDDGFHHRYAVHEIDIEMKLEEVY